MLEIKNISKAYKKDIKGWRIGKVETIHTAYLFTLMKPEGKRLQVNLERTPILDIDPQQPMFELWYWKNDLNTIIQPYAERLTLPKKSFNTLDNFIAILHLLLV